MIPERRPAGTVSPAIGIVIVLLIVGPAAGVMYLATTFLFAFSGGQFRMVPVVGYGAIAVLGATLAVMAFVWMTGSMASAVKWAGIATAVGWAVAVVVEWLLSFSLGAG